MKNINQLIRANILALKPYSSARDEFKGNEGVFLDANENPFGKINRYPDPYQKELKEKLSVLKNIAADHIFIGNGSDEVIDILFRIFCNPKQDKVIICPPTYGMYEVSANINDVETVQIPLDNNFQLDIEKVLPFIKNAEENIKMIFLCTPNNPTGNNLDNLDIILKSFKGIVVIDEAYIDFSEAESYINTLHLYPNLVVMQTFSKAWGLAAARVGVAYANPAIITFMNKVKPPYNISKLNQKAAINALNKYDIFLKNKENILKQRQYLIEELNSIKIVKKTYKTDANFILVEVINANNVYNELIRQKIIIRNRHSIIDNCIRITVGTANENKKLIKALKTI